MHMVKLSEIFGVPQSDYKLNFVKVFHLDVSSNYDQGHQKTRCETPEHLNKFSLSPSSKCKSIVCFTINYFIKD